MDLTVAQRADILRYASGLLTREDRKDPVLVGQASIPLIEWAEKAPGPADLSARMRAMSRHYVNAGGDLRTEPGDPGEFVENTSLYYAMLTGGRPVPEPRAETHRQMRELIRRFGESGEEGGQP